MRFSLVMATFGRKDEVELLFSSLVDQTYKHFELIIVDQNNDDRVYETYEKYKEYIDIKYIKSTKKGLSYNRNIGLEKCNGDIIAFPDDDCEYSFDTLEKVVSFFNENPEYSFYICNTREKHSDLSILTNTLGNSIISVTNVMNVGISFTIFVTAEKINDFKFDEQLGIGAKFGSGEESDLLFFLLKNKIKGIYHSKNYIYHPVKTETPEKAFLYGKGFGAVHKKAITQYGFFILFPIFLLRILKGILNIIIKSDKKSRIFSLHGRILGFIKYKNEQNSH